MTIPDAINGSFEALAGLMIGNHCRTLYRDKQVRGVSLLSTCFFAAWGIWNLYYYPHLGQIISFLGGLSVSTANAVWIGMMIYYRKREARFEAQNARWRAEDEAERGIEPEPEPCEHINWGIRGIDPIGTAYCKDCDQPIPFVEAVNASVARLKPAVPSARAFNHSEARNA